LLDYSFFPSSNGIIDYRSLPLPFNHSKNCSKYTLVITDSIIERSPPFLLGVSDLTVITSFLVLACGGKPIHSPHLRPESEYDLYGIEDNIEIYCSNTVDAPKNHSIMALRIRTLHIGT
jgi:hypothetical protein